MTVYTIGHSTHSSEELIRLLKLHSVTAVADVRSQPYSRLHPQFSREPLRDALDAAGIMYVFLGRELGGRSDDSTCYRDGQIQYERLATLPAFQSGIERILRGSESYTVALLCAEKDPLVCHRTLLVARHLSQQGIEVRHIRADGTFETHEEANARLLRELRLPPQDMFRTQEEILADAYRLRSEAVAYRRSEDPGRTRRAAGMR